MGAIDVTAIILAIIGMVSGWATYWFDRRKHRAEVMNLEIQIKNLETDMRHKEQDMDIDLVKNYWELIAAPLKEEVSELRNEVKELRDAVQKINDCPFSGDCPVRKWMQHEPEDGEGKRKVDS